MHEYKSKFITFNDYGRLTSLQLTGKLQQDDAREMLMRSHDAQERYFHRCTQLAMEGSKASRSAQVRCSARPEIYIMQQSRFAVRGRQLRKRPEILWRNLF